MLFEFIQFISILFKTIDNIYNSLFKFFVILFNPFSLGDVSMGLVILEEDTLF